MFKITVLLLAVLATIVAGKNVDVGGRIIGGYQVHVKEHPYIVSIHNSTDHFLCAGSIISTSWIVTVAHTLVNYKPSDLHVLSNSSSANEGVKTSVANVELHPKFAADTKDQDIAVMKLTEELTCMYCAPIKINKASPSIGETVMIIGWGSSSDQDVTDFSQLEQVEVPIVSTSYCSETYASTGKTILDDTFCVGTLQGEKLGSCAGDEGGPVFTSEGLIGIISLGDQCSDSDYPGVYTKIEPYVNWIREETEVGPA